jgi:hypothetical protein
MTDRQRRTTPRASSPTPSTARSERSDLEGMRADRRTSQPGDYDSAYVRACEASERAKRANERSEHKEDSHLRRHPNRAQVGGPRAKGFTGGGVSPRQPPRLPASGAEGHVLRCARWKQARSASTRKMPVCGATQTERKSGGRVRRGFTGGGSPPDSPPACPLPVRKDTSFVALAGLAGNRPICGGSGSTPYEYPPPPFV